MGPLVFEPARLRVARELVGMSQGQLATQIGLSAAAISQFENGAARPSAETAAALGAALECRQGSSHGRWPRPMRAFSIPASKRGF